MVDCCYLWLFPILYIYTINSGIAIPKTDFLYDNVQFYFQTLHARAAVRSSNLYLSILLLHKQQIRHKYHRNCKIQSFVCRL